MTNRQPSPTNAFHDVACTPRQHFILHLFAAIYRVIHYVRRTSGDGAAGLDGIISQHPFLGGYFKEMLAYMPDNLTWESAPDWWSEQILTWERGRKANLPLRVLSRQSGIDFNGRITLMLAGLVEEDSRFGTLFSSLQAPLGQRRPSLELLGHIIADEREKRAPDPWRICQPLLASGLLACANAEVPRAEWLMSVPALLWDVLRGDESIRLPGACTYQPAAAFPRLADLSLQETFLQKFARLPDLIKSGQITSVILRGTPGSERRMLIGAIARSLGLGTLQVEASHLPAETLPDWIGPFCMLMGVMPVVLFDLGPGETAANPQWKGYNGPCGILLGTTGGVHDRTDGKAVTFHLPMPGPEQRRALWRAALANHPVADLKEVCEHFHLPSGYIRQAGAIAIANAAIDGCSSVEIRHVREACRSLNRQHLDSLAAHLEGGAYWSQLVVNEFTGQKLHELERRCRHRERLMDQLGPAFEASNNRGVRALMTGSSGTGKTLAARILASELGMDLYRVDLAAVVNKYIGETEKNLHQVLTHAEALDVVLLLDEGDALLGSRTEVHTANDRYANLETDYLLQRLESYQGIILVTTNAGENIDSAFQRRMDVVVGFVPPQVEERWRIWHLHLPETHLVKAETLEEIAVRCALTGGQIRNAAIHATLLALDEARPVSVWHLEQAIQSEYRKAGATFPLQNRRNDSARQPSGMEAFLDAFVME
jgi:hypothetical protein